MPSTLGRNTHTAATESQVQYLPGRGLLSPWPWEPLKLQMEQSLTDEAVYHEELGMPGQGEVAGAAQAAETAVGVQQGEP